MGNQGFIFYNCEVVGTFTIYGNNVCYCWGYDKNQIDNVFDFFNELRFFGAKIYFLSEISPKEYEKFRKEYLENYS